MHCLNFGKAEKGTVRNSSLIVILRDSDNPDVGVAISVDDAQKEVEV